MRWTAEDRVPIQHVFRLQGQYQQRFPDRSTRNRETRTGWSGCATQAVSGLTILANRRATPDLEARGRHPAFHGAHPCWMGNLRATRIEPAAGPEVWKRRGFMDEPGSAAPRTGWGVSSYPALWIARNFIPRRLRSYRPTGTTTSPDRGRGVGVASQRLPERRFGTDHDRLSLQAVASACYPAVTMGP
jgi:hypothetical protein